MKDIQEIIINYNFIFLLLMFFGFVYQLSTFDFNNSVKKLSFDLLFMAFSVIIGIGSYYVPNAKVGEYKIKPSLTNGVYIEYIAEQKNYNIDKNYNINKKSVNDTRQVLIGCPLFKTMDCYKTIVNLKKETLNELVVAQDSANFLKNHKLVIN